MTAPRYVWITLSLFQDNWWHQADRNDSCTHDILREALNASLAIIPRGFLLLEGSSADTFSGMVKLYTYCHVSI